MCMACGEHHDTSDFDDAWRDEHGFCERHLWLGQDVEVCTAGESHPDDRICHGTEPIGIEIDEQFFCPPCALVMAVFAALGASDWDEAAS